jgi:multidrug resistance protein, MATE family
MIPIKPLWRESAGIVRIGIPITIAQLLNMSMGFVDTVMTGHYSAEALAAVSGSHHAVMPLLLFGAAMIGAGQAITAQFLGAGTSKPEIGQVTLHGLIIGILYALLLMGYTQIIPRFLPFFGFEPTVIRQAGDYLFAFAWGVPATMIFIAFAGFYAGIARPMMTMLAALVMLGVNVIGNYTLIFGRFGFPELGAEGAGWTSALASWSGAIGMIVVTLALRSVRPFNPFRAAVRLNRALFHQILRIGIPSGFSAIFEVSMFAVFSLLMGRFGVAVLAGSQIALNCSSIIFMIPLGFSFAITTNVGLYLGRQQYREARLVGLAGYTVNTVCNTVSAVLLLLFATRIAAIYTNDPAVAAIAADLLFLVAIFQLSDAIQVSGMGILRGYKDTRIPMLANLLSYWGVGMTLGYYLGFHLGLQAQGMWIGIIIGLTVAAILHAIRFKIVSDRTLSLR